MRVLVHSIDFAPMIGGEETFLLNLGGVVVAADIGGLGEVVGEGGLRFKAGDEAALAAVLRRILEDPNAGVELGRKARERAVERFSRHRMVDEYIALYASVVR